MDRSRTPLVLVTVAPAEGPVVSRSSSSCSLLRKLNRRLGRRSRARDCSPESRSSSTDSDEPRRRRGLRSTSSPSGSSDSSSSSGSGMASESALRKALRALSLATEAASRSHSASPTGLHPRRNSIPNANVSNSSKKSPKRILRSPVAYTYVRGLSGLPTQRVPRASTCPATPACCRNAMAKSSPSSRRLIQVPGLNR